jgi:Family of unknown function (DUF5990)
MPETSDVKVRLIHDGLQPGPEVAEPVDFGIQDKKSVVHPGKRAKGGVLHFEIDVTVTPASAAPAFSGPFVHGSPASRFLYLSWRKRGQHEHPWAWRIKMPLGAISWSLVRQAQKDGHCLEANVVGRRPHSVDTVVWRVVRA